MIINGATTNRRIYVEGRSDLQVVKVLRERTSSRTDFWVEFTGGNTMLLENIPSHLQMRQFTRNSPSAALGYVIDGDDDHLSTWNKLKLRCQDESIPEPFRVHLPDEPDPGGTVLERPRPRLRLGVWVMPDNASPGELEEFLVRMVPPENADWPRARRYVDCSEGDFGRKVTRAEVLAWIATRTTPGRFDEAITNGDLRTDGELCQRFIAWLDRLFAEAGDVVDAK